MTEQELSRQNRGEIAIMKCPDEKSNRQKAQGLQRKGKSISIQLRDRTKNAVWDTEWNFVKLPSSLTIFTDDPDHCASL